MLPWVNYTNIMFRYHRWLHWKVGTIFSDIYCVAHTFCLRRICIHSNCSVRFISKSTLPFCFPCFIQMEHVDYFSITLFETLGDFCISSVHFAIGRICVRSNCSEHYSFAKFIHCHSVSFGKLHKWNEWIISPLLYLKFNIFMHSTEISKSLLGFQIKIWDNQQFIDLFWGTSLLTQLISTEFLISI